MALGDFQVFNSFAYNSFTVTYQQQVNLFNQASNGAIVMAMAGFSGDFHERSQFENLASLVGNRDASSTTAATEHAITELLKIDVKVGLGTPNISYTDTSFDYTQRDPEEAGRLFGEAMAEGALAYQLNSVLAAAVAAMDNTDIIYDGTAGTASLDSLNLGASMFGDRQSSIVAWVMHSKSMNDIWGNSISNSNRLFQFGTVHVMEDTAGRPLIMTDSSALHFDNSGTENYHQLGLVAGGLSVEEQGDMRIHTDTDLSQVNAKKLMKVESTFGLGLKGYTWNTSVTKPDDAAIALASNWTRVTSLGHKDTAGVRVTTL